MADDQAQREQLACVSEPQLHLDDLPQCNLTNSPATPSTVKDETSAFFDTRSSEAAVERAEGKVSGSDRGTTPPWSIWYKRYLSALACVILYLTVTLASELLAPYAGELAVKFAIGETLIVLAISSFSVSYCLGPLLWCPLSEKYGRRPILLLCFNCFAILQVCAAAARNAPCLLIFRFLGGFFGSAALPLAAVVLADIWDLESREREIGTYVFNTIGPSSGAMVGAIMTKKGVDWRGICWTLSVAAGVCTLLVFLTFRETRQSYDLANGPEKCTSNQVPHSSSYARLGSPGRFQRPRPSPRDETLGRTLVRPYLLFYREPLLVICMVYLGLVGTCVNIFFKTSGAVLLSYSLVIQIVGSSSILVGCLVGLILHNTVIYPRVYLPRAREYTHEPVPPELRLFLAMWAAPLFAASFLWFGLMINTRVHAVVPFIACPLMGMSALWLMQVTLNYVIDIYEDVLATALAWYTVMTYLFITIATRFWGQMFEALSPRWILTIAGFVALAVVPVPIFLRRFVIVAPRAMKCGLCGERYP